jgi:N-acetylglutamate synthase-like GNAT family acetyltransferase
MDELQTERANEVRLAEEGDIPALERLIPLSVRALQKGYYTPAQMEAAIGTAFGVDRQLIRDRTYFVVERGSEIIGCGGWSRRAAAYGGDGDRVGEVAPLEPGKDAARIRAFFIHPEWARRGLGRALLRASEEALMAAGFTEAVLVATLAGEPLYASSGYTEVERFDGPLRDGLSIPVVRMTKQFATPTQRGCSLAT